MIKVVCNASTIIGLSQIGCLNLLYKMFEVYIPREVYNEIASAKEDNATRKEELIEAVENDKNINPPYWQLTILNPNIMILINKFNMLSA